MEEVTKKRKFGDLEIETILEEKPVEEKKEENQPKVEGGFEAYSKINPFALGISNSFGSSSGNGGGFSSLSNSNGNSANSPFAALGKATAAAGGATGTSFGFGKQSWLEGENLTLTLPSPKSPRQNPFSTPSPIHNPFVTIVNQNQDQLWKGMAQKQLENTNNNHSQGKHSSQGFRSSSVGGGEDSEEIGESADNQNSEQNYSDEQAVKRMKSSSTDNEDDTAVVGGGTGSDKESEANSPKAPQVFKTSIHLSETVLMNGEEEENCIYQGRAKLYRFKINGAVGAGGGEDGEKKDSSLEKAEWCEIGTGPIKIFSKTINTTGQVEKNGSQSHERERIAMRHEEKKGGIGTKLILNISLVAGTSFALHTENTLRMIGKNFIDTNDAVINTYLLRFEGKKECDEFYQIIEPCLGKLSISTLTRADSSTLNGGSNISANHPIDSQKDSETASAPVSTAYQLKTMASASPSAKFDLIKATDQTVFSFQFVNQTVEGVEGETLHIDDLPEIFGERYLFKEKLDIFCRSSYHALYQKIKKIILSPVRLPVMLITGVPGIGKSFFSIFFMVKLFLDEEFPVKEFFLEYEQGVYSKVSLLSLTTSTKDSYSITVAIRKGLEPSIKTDLILSDIKSEAEPRKGARWTCIFSSPNPKRYKETLKAPHSISFLMPTWSEQELLFVNKNQEEWYNRFVQFGGVPRNVLWDGFGNKPEKKLADAIISKGALVINHFFNHGFGGIDPEISYMLLHINPPWLPNENEWDYDGDILYSFASDEIFKTLCKKYEKELLNQPISLFNAGIVPEVYGGGSAGNLFEKVVLWLKPIAEKHIEITSFKTGTQAKLHLHLPPVEILSRDWKNNTNLKAERLYQPRISNLESGDSFCVIPYHDGTYILTVFQITVGANHPIKSNGLQTIVQAFPPEITALLSKRILCFVTPVDGALERCQPYHTKEGKVVKIIPSEVKAFEQFVYRYKI